MDGRCRLKKKVQFLPFIVPCIIVGLNCVFKFCDFMFSYETKIEKNGLSKQQTHQSQPTCLFWGLRVNQKWKVIVMINQNCYDFNDKLYHNYLPLEIWKENAHNHWSNIYYILWGNGWVTIFIVMCNLWLIFRTSLLEVINPCTKDLQLNALTGLLVCSFIHCLVLLLFQRL